MSSFSMTVLGSNSAYATLERFTTAQVVQHHGKLFLLDCGEGIQIPFRKYNIKFSHIDNIFITHLHSDHYLGLPGLFSIFNLLRRTKPLKIFSPAGLEEILKPFIDSFNGKMHFQIEFNVIEPTKISTVYQDERLSIETIPLKHKLPCCGYIFREKPSKPNISKAAIAKYNLSIEEIKAIKAGKDYLSSDGQNIENKEFMECRHQPRSYAYCTDTMLLLDNVKQLSNVNLMFHDSTYVSEEDLIKSKTMHSSANQAALLAKEANIGILLLGHFSSKHENIEQFEQAAKPIFANSIAVKDGMEFDI